MDCRYEPPYAQMCVWRCPMAENARARILRPSELIRAAGVARRYYVNGMSKVDIADELGISRFKVARVLEEAREAGLVHIEISVPAEIDADLSDALRSAFGLHDAIVVATGDDEGSAERSQVGRVAATYLMEIIEEGDVIGLACSRTLHDMARVDGAAQGDGRPVDRRPSRRRGGERRGNRAPYGQHRPGARVSDLRSARRERRGDRTESA
ncbi:MAG: hypothetical protein GEU86_21345 [Actinophytocola sp.]|nr:hypothetical protein [Actinophytocola sp.]